MWFYVLPVAQYHGILGTSRQNQIACCWIDTTQVASIYPPVLVNGLGRCLRIFIISIHNLGTASNHHTHITMRQSGSIRQGGGLAFGIEKNAFCVNLFNQYTTATQNGIFQLKTLDFVRLKKSENVRNVSRMVELVDYGPQSSVVSVIWQ
jgi:hypothetical protein